MPSQEVLKLTIECSNLPPQNWGGHSEIWLGIQQGKEVVQAVKLPADKIVFEAEFRVSPEPKQGTPNFLGPYAQGTVQDRFFYLCWVSRQGGHHVGFRRAKIPLSGLTWEVLKSNHLLAEVRCTDEKGGPICATVRNGVTWRPQPSDPQDVTP